MEGMSTCTIWEHARAGGDVARGGRSHHMTPPVTGHIFKPSKDTETAFPTIIVALNGMCSLPRQLLVVNPGYQKGGQSPSRAPIRWHIKPTVQR